MNLKAHMANSPILGSILVFGLAYSSSNRTVPTNWFTDLFSKSEKELRAAGVVNDNEDGLSTIAAKPPFESFTPYFNKSGKLVWLSSSVASPPGDWRLALSELEIKPGQTVEFGKNGLRVARFVGMPSGWQGFVYPPGSIDFMSPEIGSRIDLDRLPIAEKEIVAAFKSWNYGSWKRISDWVGKPKSALSAKMEIFNLNYPVSGRIESLDVGIPLLEFLGEAGQDDVTGTDWFNVTFAKSVKSAAEALKILGLANAKVGAKQFPDNEGSASFVDGTGLPLKKKTPGVSGGEGSVTIGQNENGQWYLRYQPPIGP